MSLQTNTRAMLNPRGLVLLLLLLLLLLRLGAADVGTAAWYGPPYLPSACYGSDGSQFPEDRMFAAAGEGIWDNGASCGRVYKVRCLSSPTPGACNHDAVIDLLIVDQAATIPSAPHTTLLLSLPAFTAMANPSANAVNVELTQV